VVIKGVGGTDTKPAEPGRRIDLLD